MNKIRRVSELLLFWGCIFIYVNGVTRSLAMPSPNQKDWSLGVSPEDESYYKRMSTSTEIKCRDGSKKINRSQLNDDFCDCPDGSDEPGTSACPYGKFYCKNAGHAPVFLYSSRVNDGICDCCDGSDEYDGKTKCLNTCWEAGKVAREKLRKKISTYREGVTIRKQQIEQAKLSIAKDEAELSKLRNEEKILKALVETLKERKEQIEKAEEKERLQKEKEEKERKEAEEPKEEKETDAEDNKSVQNDLHDEVENADQAPQDSAEDHDEAVGETELNEHSIEEGHPHDVVDEATESSSENPEQLGEDSTINGNTVFDTEDQIENVAEDTGSLSREELGRRIASRWTGEKTDEQKEILETSLNEDNNPDVSPSESNYEEDNGYASEYDEHKYDDDDVNEDQADDGANSHYDPSPVNPDFDEDLELSDSSSASWLEKIQKKVKSVFQAVNLFKTPVNISEAAVVRKDYDDSSSKLSKLQSKISSLTRKLKQDFGPEKEFYSFYGQCFESKQNKYVYKVCPFKQATQVEGYSTTRLGNWEKFDDSYKTLKFDNGDKCWNGPDRSMKVKLRCGLKNELTDVDEPSRCEYVALLSTPALCLDSKLKELQEKLVSLNKDQPQDHDEL